MASKVNQGNISEPWTTLTPAVGSVTPDCSTSSNFIVTPDAALTIQNPTGMHDGQAINILVTQPPAAFWGLSWGAAFKWPGGAAGTATAANAAIDSWSFVYNLALTAWYPVGANLS